MKGIKEYLNEYLNFVEWPSISGKTRIVNVFSKSSGAKIGELRWLGRWRQYCFFPSAGTVWSIGCLAEISGYIVSLMPGRIKDLEAFLEAWKKRPDPNVKAPAPVFVQEGFAPEKRRSR